MLKNYISIEFRISSGKVSTMLCFMLTTKYDFVFEILTIMNIGIDLKSIWRDKLHV
jgi:hypothetical protein